MKTACALLFAAVAAAAPGQNIPSSSTPESFRFTGVAVAISGDVVPINANDLKFWTGKDTRTFSEVEEKQANTDKTIFEFDNGTGQLKLSVNVPGGQEVYVTNEGKLRFTPAHQVKTAGHATFTGFDIIDNNLQFEKQDWISCRKSDDGKSPARRIYAASRASTTSPPEKGQQCIGIKWLVDRSDYPSAWAYE